MSAVNNITLIGNVGNDPKEDFKEFGGDKKKTQIRLAVRRTYKNGSGEYDTDWVNVNFWNRKAENAAEYIEKGARIAISGELRTDKYEDSKGQLRNAFFVEGDHFQIIGGKKSSGDSPF